MRHLLLSVCAILFASSLTISAQIPYWNNVQITEVGREYPRTEFATFDSRTSAIEGQYEDSPYYLSLNGTWKFVYVDDYRTLPKDIEQPSFSNLKWKSIKVPGNWERQGFGTAIYVNMPYEFKYGSGILPQLPEIIPAGVYRRDFTVPQEWDGKNVYLNIDGAKSGVYVYVNGKEAGYAENSKDRAQFKINDYITKGDNTLVIKIMRWSTGSWLECQDFWRISGIERDVYLSAQDKISLKDFRILSTLDTSLKNGIFKIDMMVDNADREVVNVSYELIDNNGITVASGSRKIDEGIAAGQEWKTETQVSFRTKIMNIKSWSAEDPHLYTLIMKVNDKYIPYRVGFRRFEISDSMFLVNGQPVKFKGVNIHEHDMITGHYVSKETMRKDLELMRKHNINAIRTSHYPQPRYFYELCDEIGMYVYCEANVESHGMGYNLREGGTLGNNRMFYGIHMDRIINMYERCKNFPCVTILSLGNEAGNGYNFYKAYEWIEEREKGENNMNRPICYERAGLEWNTDMYVPQYPTAEWFAEIGEKGCDRPVVPSEYSHGMGNSNGGIVRQWKSINLYPHLQGGFIWDWVNQGFLETDPNGRQYWTYGGDYGVDMPSDANFCCNGIVAPDRRPHPAMEEVKKAYSNVAFDRADPSQEKEFYIINRFYFTDLSKYDISYSILENRKSIRSGKLSLNTAPQKAEPFNISYKGLKFNDNSDYYIVFSVKTKVEERLIPAGYEIASEQFPLSLKKAVAFGEQKTPFKMKKGSALKISEDEASVQVSSNRIHFSFDKSSCTVNSLKIDGKEVFAEGYGIRPDFWRAPIDNDYGNGMNRKLAIWKEASSAFKSKVSASMDGENGVVKVTYALPTYNIFEVKYTITPSAVVHVGTYFSAVAADAPGSSYKNVPYIPRIGVRFRLPATKDAFQYFGRGPAENYCDRKYGSNIGLYSTTASDQYFPYVMPQECGHHCDTRFIKFDGISIVADDFMEFNILRNSIEDLDLGKQKHINDVTPRDYVEVCLDYRQMGVGGYDSWGAVPDTDAMIPTDTSYRWGFTLYVK